EEKLLESSQNADETYVNEVLPEKMKYNLEYIKNFNFFGDIKIMFKTVIAVISR
ncbi:MAG: sugar transferase, partial [Clostridia bacterium]|nr:sugar transferase [Clostridia bacterium]